AEETGLPVVVSSALESSVGIAAGVALAAALPELPYACGLATVQLFERDVTDDPLLPVQGFLPVRRVAPSTDALAAMRADGETQRRWYERVRAVAAGGRPWPPPSTRARSRRAGPRPRSSRTACRTSCSHPAPAPRRSPTRWPRPSGRDGCGCTCGSTSGWRGSSRSASRASG